MTQLTRHRYNMIYLSTKLEQSENYSLDVLEEF